MNKKKKKILTVITLLLICSIITAFIVKPSKQEIYAKEFLYKFYNISDYEQFNYLTKSASASVAAVNDQDSIKYRSYFTDNGYDKFIAQKINAFYEELAYENKCTLSVKSVDFEQTRYENFDELREFNFKAVIEVRYTGSKDVHTFTQEGTINVISKNGQNKIDSIEFTGQEEIQKEIANN